jgi:hypothetical protein
MKLQNKPLGDKGLAVVVVPKAIGDALSGEIRRNWLGMQILERPTAAVFYL